ncbi:lipoyl(octanoyl) transferase LipB [Desulfopila sp. IMCC35008]|uniref:lipoyl(octanoyl) transferase LipB n=1 Tax=Desulfopila sp. IMCC35008 TaxID=2653858 RepID=UPI0013D8C2C9|nr:lipoyl(octanoyl) transferase LipB [Desulfopila sp. IMCC35008]
MSARIAYLGVTDYAEIHALQVCLTSKRRDDTIPFDIFLVTEHRDTFTLGRSGGRENLMVSEQFLREKGIPLVQVERGGDITYHGRGQLVIYPIFHMRKAGLTVSEYVYRMEELMIKLAAENEVHATRSSRNHGVWVQEKKLGSVGIAVRHGVAFHGLALNVNINLEPFFWVNPCGLTGVQMTSLSNERGKEILIEDIETDLGKHISSVFTCSITQIAKDHPDIARHE